MMQQEGWKFVYLMKQIDVGASLYKIGMSGNVERRRRQLQYKNRWSIRLMVAAPSIDARTAERYLHRLFARRRIFGEWFDLRPFEIDFICDYLYRLDQEAAFAVEYWKWADGHPGWPDSEDSETSSHALD